PVTRTPPPPCMLGWPWLSPSARSWKKTMPRNLGTPEPSFVFVALAKYAPSYVQGPSRTSPETLVGTARRESGDAPPGQAAAVPFVGSGLVTKLSMVRLPALPELEPKKTEPYPPVLVPER